eukprot:5073045-Pleurochrysis_carterae.AAC.1
MDHVEVCMRIRGTTGTWLFGRERRGPVAVAFRLRETEKKAEMSTEKREANRRLDPKVCSVRERTRTRSKRRSSFSSRNQPCAT